MPLQNNPYKLTSQVSLAPDPQLASMMEHYKGSGDAVSFSVVFNEVQRRKEIRDAAQAKMSGGPKQKVADQLIQEAKQAQMPAQPQGGPPQGGPPQGGPPQGGPPQGGPPQGMPQGMPPGPPQGGPPQGGPPQGMPPGPPQGMPPGPPQGMPPQGGPLPDMGMPPQEGGPPQGMANGGYLLPEDTGIAQLPARNLENMAGGGLVSFAYGGDIPGYAEAGYVGEFGESGVPYRSDYAPPLDEEALDDDYPRLSSRDSDDNSYEKIAEELRTKNEREIKEYGEQRKALGPAYAGAEERNKEMTQRYADEERSLKGLPWIIGGAALMQSRKKGLGGLGEAVTAALPQYLSGREKLSSLKDKQRDYMQTVAEARRAESLGNLDKMRELTASMDKQRLDIAGTSEQLKLNREELGIKRTAADAKGSNIKVQEEYNRRAMMYRDAADDPKNASFREAYLAEAEKFQNLADTMAAQSSGVPYKIDAARQKALGDKGNAVRYALKLRRDPKTKAQGNELLQSVSGETGVPVPELIQRFSGSNSAGSGAGDEEEVQFESMKRKR